MFPSKVLLSLVLLCTSIFVDAVAVNRRTGKATLSFATKLNTRSGLNIAEIDRARAQALKQAGQLGKRNVFSAGATNTGVNYEVQVGIGSPPTDYTLILDTGSSNLWVGADKAYVQTSTSHNIGRHVSLSYGSGSFQGEEWTDTVTLSPDLVIYEQSLGVASSSTGIAPGTDGIIGVGPTDLTQKTVDGVSEVPTVMDNLYSQGTISEEALGVYFTPYSDSQKGELTFGGYDDSVTTAPMVYVPLTQTSPANTYWGIDQSIAYGAETILSLTAGIVDTGTTGIVIATDAFKKYQQLTGGVMDSATGLLKITSDQYNALESLWFNIGGVPFELTPNAQIWPRSLNTAIGGEANAIYLVVIDLGSNSGSGLDFLNGYTFLERYYTVYDTTHKSVGIAPTRYTASQSN